MAEIADLESVLRMIDHLPPLWRVLLSTPGTLQGTLAALFRTPVTVKLIDQSIVGPRFDRTVELVRSDRGEAVCYAHTEAEVDSPEIHELLVGGKAGIGQILRMKNIEAVFELHEIGGDDATIERSYRLAGGGSRFEIVERFPRLAFHDHAF
jgi:chorismate-pyruvate lyase